MNDCITTAKQSITKPCAYFLGFTVCGAMYVINYPCPNPGAGLVNVYLQKDSRLLEVLSFTVTYM